ncbi:MAG: lacto-N-biose phosphorylase central domain-containing protein [Ruthenibacterium sp.]
MAALNAWVYQGGAFIGVNEPSAVPHCGENFRMAGVLGIDKDTGARVCHGRRSYAVECNQTDCDMDTEYTQ